MTDGPRRLVLDRGRIAILAGVLGAIVLALLINLVAGAGAREQQAALMEDEVTGVVLAYGRAPGGEACQYLSTEALERLGGEEGCQQHFFEAPSVEFEIESLAVDGVRADARVRNPRTGYPQDFDLIVEDDAWKISYFRGLESILPPEQEEPVPTLPEPTEPVEPTPGTETETEPGTTAPEEDATTDEASP